MDSDPQRSCEEMDGRVDMIPLYAEVEPTFWDGKRNIWVLETESTNKPSIHVVSFTSLIES